MSDLVPGRRVLIVSYWFAPFSTIASVRAGKLARYLTDHGWEVRVLTADATDPDISLPVEIPRDRITYAKWSRVDWHTEKVRGMLRTLRGRKSAGPRAPTTTAAVPGDTRKASGFRNALADAYRDIIEWPDNRVGWRKPALAAGRDILKAWRPDVIYATAPPATALVVADRLAQKANIPWVAEMRDLWTDHPYYERSRLRAAVERVWDRRVVSRAAAIVSVSPAWRSRLIAHYRRPVVVAMNGFVTDDFPVPAPLTPATSGPLHIVFTGHIYGGYRDPSPLFEALSRLRLTQDDVIVEFIGSSDKAVRDLAARFGLAGHVRVQRTIPYRQALEHQLRADVLLHMQWCDPKEYGTIAGKIFDYLGARRPILGIALEDSAVAKLVHERGAGLVTNDPEKIAAQVKAWAAEKRRGGIAPLPPSACAGLERSHQFEKVAALLAKIAAGAALPLEADALANAG